MEPNNTPAPAATQQPAQPDNKTDLVLEALNKIDATLQQFEPKQTETHPPLGAGRVENMGNPAIEKYNSLKIDRIARGQFVREYHAELRKELLASKNIKSPITDRFDYRNPDVMAVNTIDAGLANSLLSMDAITVMRRPIAPILAFSRKVELSPVSKRQVINVPLVSSSGSVQSNASNYETGDTTAGDVAVTVNEVSKSFYVGRGSQNLGLELAQLAPTNAMVLGEGLMAIVTALFDEAGTNIGAAANFDSADLPAILALAKDFRRVTLLLDGGHLAYLLPTTRESFAFGEPGAYGFDGGIYKNNQWTGSVSNCVGLVTGPDSVAVAVGPPADLPAGEAISTETVTVVGDISVQSTVWFSRASRAMWGCYAVMFGAANGDETQRKTLVSS
jgi:hypothetical protein